MGKLFDAEDFARRLRVRTAEWGISQADAALRKWAAIASKRIATANARAQAAEAERDQLQARLDQAVEALRECQSALAVMVSPEAIRQTTVINAYAQAMAADAGARAVLTSLEAKP